MISSCNKKAKHLHKNNERAGFTLIEVLVAIAVITVIGFLPISIISDHIIRNALTENRVTAGLLAQEITEYVRYTRDSDILDPNGGDWFDTLYDPQAKNEYRNCIVYADDWILGNHKNYCTVECFDVTNKSAQGECGTTSRSNRTYTGSIAGIATTGNIRGKNADTCDGNQPKDNNEFTTTLEIIIPQEDTEVQYATVVPCISWSDKTNVIKKVKTQESVFEWIQKRK